MKYSVDKQSNYTTVTFQQENLNSVVAPSLKSQLVILHNEGTENLILNLEDVKFVDSSGLSAILTANRLWKDNGYFVLTGIKHKSVKKLITISRLDSILTIIPTVEESINYIKMDKLNSELSSED